MRLNISYDPSPDGVAFKLIQSENGKWIMVDSWNFDYYFLDSLRGFSKICFVANQLVDEVIKLRLELKDDNCIKQLKLKNEELEEENDNLKMKISKYKSVLNDLKEMEI